MELTQLLQVVDAEDGTGGVAVATDARYTRTMAVNNPRVAHIITGMANLVENMVQFLKNFSGHAG